MIYVHAKIPILYILEGLGMKNVHIISGNLESFTAIWYILWPFGILFPQFGILYRDESGNPVRHPLHTATAKLL
jgi:hypothetical protein